MESCGRSCSSQPPETWAGRSGCNLMSHVWSFFLIIPNIPTMKSEALHSSHYIYVSLAFERQDVKLENCKTLFSTFLKSNCLGVVEKRSLLSVQGKENMTAVLWSFLLHPRIATTPHVHKMSLGSTRLPVGPFTHSDRVVFSTWMKMPTVIITIIHLLCLILVKIFALLEESKHWCTSIAIQDNFNILLLNYFIRLLFQTCTSPHF